MSASDKETLKLILKRILSLLEALQVTVNTISDKLDYLSEDISCEDSNVDELQEDSDDEQLDSDPDVDLRHVKRPPDPDMVDASQGTEREREEDGRSEAKVDLGVPVVGSISYSSRRTILPSGPLHSTRSLALPPIRAPTRLFDPSGCFQIRAPPPQEPPTGDKQ